MIAKDNKKLKVAIGMSGGVDSSVAAKILKDRGYEVIGFMMKLWSDNTKSCRIRDNACCDLEGLQDAKRIAAILDIPFYVVDIREEFKKEIVDYFIEEYKNLRTPNPCVRCNDRIKFGWMLQFAKKIGCNYLATGHYANIKNFDGQLDLLKGKDKNKDQSYFLYRLNQNQLKHVVFPVGEFEKEQVRKMAKNWGLPVHQKKESQEICFIQEKDYREFLRKNIPGDYFEPGGIVDLKGNVLGKHEGLINYTIGQRRGIEQSIKLQGKDKEPLYAIGFNLKKNELVVGKNKEVFSDSMTLTDLIFTSEDNKKKVLSPKSLKVKIRYRHSEVPVAGVHLHKSGSLLVNFEDPQRAITPGQSAVFYDGEIVLGGGVIES